MTRYLEEELWTEVKQTIEGMPKDDKHEREHPLRTRWLFSLLYLWDSVGKGDKTRIVPATHELMVELARYRREKGLVAFPCSR